MSQRAALLDLERRKLALLRSKLAEQERRVKTLEAMDDDPFDALLERELAAPIAVAKDYFAATPAHATPASVPLHGTPSVTASPLPPVSLQWGAQARRPRRVPPIWARLLPFIGLEGKTYEQVTNFIATNQLGITPGAARTQLMIYRKEHGFIENPRKGFYRATPAAMEFLRQQAAQDGGTGRIDDLAAETIAAAATNTSGEDRLKEAA